MTKEEISGICKTMGTYVHAYYLGTGAFEEPDYVVEIINADTQEVLVRIRTLRVNEISNDAVEQENRTWRSAWELYIDTVYKSGE